jgi:hypothetical protein
VRPRFKRKGPAAVRRMLRELAPQKTTAPEGGTPGPRQTPEQQQKKRRQAALYAFAQGLGVAQRPRVANCHRKRSGPQGVQVQRGADGRLKFCGIETCASVWACPICARKILAKRCEEVTKFVLWARSRGLQVYMLTLTLRHDAALALRPALDALARSWTDWFAGGARQLRRRKSWGVRAAVRVHEITHGSNGWHPHTHVLVAGTRIPDKDELYEAQLDWVNQVSKRLGRRGMPNIEHGLTLSQHPAAEYATKLGLEIARIDSKPPRRPGHRNVWQIARAAADGDQAAQALWTEYVEATFRRRQMGWSVGAKRAAGIKERSDWELANEAPSEKPKALTIPPRIWDRIVKAGMLPVVVRLAERSLESLAHWLDTRWPAPGTYRYHILE